MSRHSSSAVEQVLGLLFLAGAGIVAAVVVVGRFLWNIYTYVPEDAEHDHRD